MNRRSFLSGLFGAGVVSVAPVKYFLPPLGGWAKTENLYTPVLFAGPGTLLTAYYDKELIKNLFAQTPFQRSSLIHSIPMASGRQIQMFRHHIGHNFD